MSNLKQWVGDNVLQHLGQSDSTTVDYFIALGQSPARRTLSGRPLTLPCRSAASKSKSPAALLATLSENGLPATSAASAFASELHARAPRKAPTNVGLSAKAKANAEDARRKAEKERAAMQKQRFSLVMDDDQPAPAGDDGAKRVKRDKGKGKASKSLRTKDDGDAWESDEEERAAKRRREDERWAREIGRAHV